jgi:cob(I)alamin adenosyltransferase
LDELNALVGVAIATLDASTFADVRDVLLCVQHELFDCGSDLAYANPKQQLPYKVHEAMIVQLERWIDHFDAQNAPITRFILPGGTAGAAALHVCRTVCRRAERRIVTFFADAPIQPHVLSYVNRLSDLLFVLARIANARAGMEDVAYVRSADVFR